MAKPFGYEFLAQRRLSYGATQSSSEDFLKLGKTPKVRYSAFLEQQLNPAVISDDDCQNRIQKEKFTCLDKPAAASWADHHQKPAKLKEELEKKQNEMSAGMPMTMQADIKKMRIQPVLEVERAAWLRAVYSRRQLFEKMVHFWHDHFSVFAPDDNIAPGFAVFDRDVIRKHAFGNFRELLGAVAQSPAMIFYLDNFVNQSGNANENYARELIELHTLGADHYLGTMDRSKVSGYRLRNPKGYVDGDVYEAARCFTGWRVDTGKDSKETGEFLYFEPWHDRFQKIFLGQNIKEYQSPMKDGNDVLDILSSHPGTSNFIALKLCRRFYGDNPPKSLVRKAARVFRENRKSPKQIALTLKSIFTASEFIQTSEFKFLRPFEYTVSVLRGLSAEFTPSEKFINTAARTGHRLFHWRSPDGYPDMSSKWDNTGSVLECWRLSHQILHSKIDGVQLSIPELSPSVDPGAWVQKSFERLALHQPTKDEVAGIKDFLGSSADLSDPKSRKQYDAKIASAVGLILMSPSIRLS